MPRSTGPPTVFATAPRDAVVGLQLSSAHRTYRIAAVSSLRWLVLAVAAPPEAPVCCRQLRQLPAPAPAFLRCCAAVAQTAASNTRHLSQGQLISSRTPGRLVLEAPRRLWAVLALPPVANRRVHLALGEMPSLVDGPQPLVAWERALEPLHGVGVRPDPLVPEANPLHADERTSAARRQRAPVPPHPQLPSGR